MIDDKRVQILTRAVAVAEASSVAIDVFAVAAACRSILLSPHLLLSIL